MLCADIWVVCVMRGVCRLSVSCMLVVVWGVCFSVNFFYVACCVRRQYCVCVLCSVCVREGCTSCGCFLCCVFVYDAGVVCVVCVLCACVVCVVGVISDVCVVYVVYDVCAMWILRNLCAVCVLCVMWVLSGLCVMRMFCIMSEPCVASVVCAMCCV